MYKDLRYSNEFQAGSFSGIFTMAGYSAVRDGIPVKRYPIGRYGAMIGVIVVVPSIVGRLYCSFANSFSEF